MEQVVGYYFHWQTISQKKKKLESFLCTHKDVFFIAEFKPEKKPVYLFSFIFIIHLCLNDTSRFLSVIITVIKLNIPSDLPIRDRAPFFVSRERPIFSVPLEELLAPTHAFHVLALMRVWLEQHEGRVCRQDDGVLSVAVRAAAVMNQRVFTKFAVWHRASIVVVVVAVFIIPANEPFVETCWR